MIRLIFNIAFKFILHKTKGILSFVRKTFYLAIIGLILSVLSLILLDSIGNGYKYNLKNKLLELESDIEISANNTLSANNLIAFIRNVSNEGVSNYCVTNNAPAIIKISSSSEGIQVLSYEEGDCDQSLNKGEIILGVELKDKLKIDYDAKVSIIDPYKLTESMGLNKAPIALSVKSFLNTGTHRDKYTAIIHREDFLTLFGTNNDYVNSSLKIYLKNSSEQDNLKNILYENFDIYMNSNIYTFNEKYEKLSQALSQIFIIISIILYFFVALAILNITSSIWLIVESKKNQIYYLILVGMRKYQVCLIFMIVSMLLIIGSFLIGYALAELILAIQNKYSIISIPSNVYMVSDLMGILDYSYILLFFVIFIIIGIIFSFIPCYRSIRRQDICV